MRSKHEGTAQGPFFAELAAAIEADRETLRALMADLQVPKSRIKEAAAWVVEKVSRLKLNDRLTGSPQVVALLEMETLSSLGIEGKLALWKSLKTVADRHPRLAATPLDDLMSRAQPQLDGLERHRLTAATDALRP